MIKNLKQKILNFQFLLLIIFIFISGFEINKLNQEIIEKDLIIDRQTEFLKYYQYQLVNFANIANFNTKSCYNQEKIIIDNISEIKKSLYTDFNTSDSTKREHTQRLFLDYQLGIK